MRRLAGGAALLALAAIACDGGGPPGPSAPPGADVFLRECSDVTPTVPGVTLPEGFPPYEGWIPTRTAKQGATRLFFGLAPAPENDVVAVQDRIAAQVRAAGLTVVDADHEGQAEADLLFDGRYEGSAQVTPVCRQTVQIRYRFSG